MLLYRLSYFGTFLGTYDTAKEALNDYESHEKLIRPVVDPKKSGQYSIREGNKELKISDLRHAAKAEPPQPKPPAN